MVELLLLLADSRLDPIFQNATTIQMAHIEKMIQRVYRAAHKGGLECSVGFGQGSEGFINMLEALGMSKEPGGKVCDASTATFFWVHRWARGREIGDRSGGRCARRLSCARRGALGSWCRGSARCGWRGGRRLVV